MATVRQINALLDESAPQQLSEPWDNDGVMLCANLDKEVKKVLFALEVRQSTAQYAAKNGFDLIITHHPLIFKPLSRIVDTNYKLFEALIKNGISVLSYHTRFDKASGGMNDALAALLELTDVTPLGEDGLGRIGSLPSELSCAQLGLFAKEMLGCESVIMSRCDGGKKIKRAAVVGGAGKDYIYEAAKSGADAFVSSEIPHHLLIEAEQLSLCVLDCGHYYTERIGAKRLEQIVADGFNDIHTELYDVKSPYTCI